MATVNNVGKPVVVKMEDGRFNGVIQKNVFGTLDVKLEDGREIKCKVADLLTDGTPEVAPTYVEQKVPLAYTDAGLQSKIAEAPAPSGVYVIKDEWHGNIEEGDVFGEAARPWMEANPDKEFRFLSDVVVARKGTRGYTPVYDANATKVKVGGQTLAHIPKEVYKQRREKQEALNKENRAAIDDNAKEAMDRAVHEGGGSIQPLTVAEQVGPYGMRRITR